MIVSGGEAVGFAPQALGETTPLIANGWFGQTPTGLTLSGKFATYAALYRVQPSVATVVDKIANSAARLTLKVWDTSPAAGKMLDIASPYARLLASPSSYMSPYNFWRWTFSTYEVYGEAFWMKQRNPETGKVKGLLPMHPSNVSIKRDDNGEVVYLFAIGVGSTGLLELPASEVVPFLRFSPDSLMRGMSRLEPLRSTMLNEDAARRATASWWQRGARPSVALKHPGELSAGAQSRLRANWESQHSGADLMGGTAILEEGMEAQVIQLSAEEMQYIESRKMNLQEVCMVYDVPPPVVHILDHATFSNITEQMRSMYRDTMAPRLEDIESALDFHLRPEFSGDGALRASFSLDEVLRGDFETRAAAVGSLIEKGVYKPAEARPLFDLPEAGPEADVLYGNAALVPLGSSVHGQTVVLPTGQEEQSPNIAAAPASVPSTRALMGRVGSVKGSGGDVRQALIDEHAAYLADVFTQQLAAGSTEHSDIAGGLTMLARATAKALNGSVPIGIDADSAAFAAAVNAETAEMITQLDAWSSEPEFHMRARALRIATERVAALAPTLPLTA